MVDFKLRIKILLLSLIIFDHVYAKDIFRPLIGITSDFYASENDTVGCAQTDMSYINAVLEAGGAPVVLPPVRSEQAIFDFIERLDGLVLVGGLDVPPFVYGEKAHPTVDSLAEKRFWFESRLIAAWLKTSDKPILGICLGCQFANVMCGGTLVQDIPSEVLGQVKHRETNGASHEVNLVETSRLFTIFAKERMTVNSYHHQAVDKVGENLVVAAYSPDGLVEALEWPGERFGLFVQWHPERMEYEHRSKLFGAFIKACK